MRASPCRRGSCWQPCGGMTSTRARTSSTCACGACGPSLASTSSRRCAGEAISSPATDAGGLSGVVRFAIRVSWPFRPGLLDAAWAAFSAINLVAILAFPGWENIPFYAIWISFTLLYGFRTWAPKPTLWVLAAVMAATAAGIVLDVARGAEPGAQLTEVPLMAAMFLVMVWHARRKLAAEHESRLAEHESRLVGEEKGRVLAPPRRGPPGRAR